MSEQVASAAELDALLVGSVIRCDDNEGIGLNVAERQPSGWCYVGSSLRFTAAQVAAGEMRFAVLYRPDQPQRVQPSREKVVAALKGVWFNLSDEFLGRFADAALALFAQQPTVAEVKAEALREAAREFRDRLPDGTGNGRAYNSWRVGQMLDQRADILAPQPHEADSIEREARP